MRSNYKKLGGYIRPVDERNSDLAITNLQGVSISKEFVPSIANIIGTDLSTYKIVRTGQFAYGPVTSRNGDKVSIALLKGEDCIISSSYSPFEVYKPDELLPEYLMLWFMRPEFDRYARFMSNGSAREVFDWDCMCGVELPVPSIDEQCKIVHDYQVITDRIELLRKMNENLEEQANNIYFKTFGSYDVLNKDITLPDGWRVISAENVYNISIGKTPPREETECFTYNPDDVTWVSIADMKKANPFIIDSTEKLTQEAVANYNVKVIPKNTILLSFKMTVGRVAIADREMTTNEAIAHFPCSLNSLYYTYCMLRNYNYLKLGSTSSITTAINSKIIKAMPILWPSSDALNGFSKSTEALFRMMKNNAKEMYELDHLGNMVIASMSK